MRNLSKYLLIFILGLGFLIRIINVDRAPAAMYGDELTIAYDSYSILSTLHDQTGKFLPLTFPMGAGRPGGYVYFSVPFIALFGPTALGARALSILSGLGIIVLSFLLGRTFFNRRIGVISAFLMAISPWDLNLSRGGFEAHFALFLALLGIVALINFPKRPILLVLSAFCFGLVIHTYPTYKLVLLLFLPTLALYVGNFKSYFRNKLILSISLLILSIFAIASITQTFGSNSEERFSQINVFSLPDLKSQIVQRVNNDRVLSSLPESLKPIFHNSYLEYGYKLADAYIKNLSPDFLFLTGDHNPRHNQTLMGGFYLVELLSVLIGLISLFQGAKRIRLFLLAWILIAPISTALLLEPHFLRSAFLLPPVIFLSALGIDWIYRSSNGSRWTLLTIFTIGITIQVLFLINKLFFISPNEFSRFWSYPARQASEMAMEQRQRYDYIILSDRVDNLEYAYPTYARIDPQLVINQNRQRTELNGLSFKKFDNVYIGSIPDSRINQFLSELRGSALYIGPVEDKKSVQNYSLPLGLDKREAFLVVKK